MRNLERKRVWWIGLGVGTVGTFTTNEADVQAASDAGWTPVEYVPATDAEAVSADALDRLARLLATEDGDPPEDYEANAGECRDYHRERAERYAAALQDNGRNPL
jgi:hypothetical protein